MRSTPTGRFTRDWWMNTSTIADCLILGQSWRLLGIQQSRWPREPSRDSPESDAGLTIAFLQLGV
jgi:hypothetical protein